MAMEDAMLWPNKTVERTPEEGVDVEAFYECDTYM